jgi:hypothetical protein
MIIRKTGPETESDYPERKIIWGHDFTHGDGEMERPFADDEPTQGHGWDTRSRWGSRPAREYEPKNGLLGRVWSRLRNVLEGQDPMGKGIPND